MTTWNEIADRFVHVLETGEADELERLYHPRLRFTVRTVGTAHDRDAALAAFRRLWPLLCDVRVEIVTGQLECASSGHSRNDSRHAAKCGV